MKTNYAAAVSVGLVLGLTTISVCLAFSQVIYSGVLSDFLPFGVAFSLMGAGFLALIICLYSDIPSAIARPQDEPLPMVILLAQSIGAYFASGHAAFLTILAMMVLTGIITGMTLYLFGKLQWGKLARYFPFPVVAGLLAGSGLLLVLTSLHQILPLHELSWVGISKLSDPYSVLLWLPSILYGVIVFILSMRFKSTLLFPASIVVGIALFYLVSFGVGISIESLKSHGLLLAMSPISVSHVVEKITLSDPIQWHFLIINIPIMIAIAFICVISLLFITNSLELTFSKTVDFNKELKVAGVANIISACAGGIVGYHGLGNAIIASKFSANNRIVGIVCGICCFAVLIFPSIIHYFPIFILVGLVIFLGISLFYSWTFAINSRLRNVDRLLIYTVILTVLSLGFIRGMVVGILIAILFFTYTYSKVNIVRYVFSGKRLSSPYQRDPTATTILKMHGDQIVFVRLQGFIFFGSANSLVEHVKGLLESRCDSPVKYIIYDVSKVSGFDTSSFLSFERIAEFAQDNHLTVIVTGFDKNTFNMSAALVATVLSQSGIMIVENVDDAINHCELGILGSEGYDSSKVENEIISLEDYLGNKSFVNDIKMLFEEIALSEGEHLVRQDDLSHELFYLESGLLEVCIEEQNGGKQILSIIGPGNIVGEVAFYLHSKRSASVVAKKNCIIRKLSQKNLKKMKADCPELAYTLQQAIICLLSYKLINTTVKLDILSK